MVPEKPSQPNMNDKSQKQQSAVNTGKPSDKPSTPAQLEIISTHVDLDEENHEIMDLDFVELDEQESLAMIRQDREKFNKSDNRRQMVVGGTADLKADPGKEAFIVLVRPQYPLYAPKKYRPGSKTVEVLQDS